MACVALTSLMATIELEFLIPNHRVCLNDEKPLKSVFDKLSSLEAFLKKEYKGKGGGPIIRDVEIKIRDFALKAEDAIEIQVRNILVAKHKEHGELHLHQTLQQVAKEAQELFNIINNTTTSEPDNILSGGSLQFSPELDDDIIMVGDLNFWSLRGKLFQDTQERVISIFGVPGVGKTTICRKLYTNEGVVSYFEIQAWVTIPPPPRQYNVQQLLCGLFQSMRPTIADEIDMENTSVFQLKDQLCKHLKSKRYLIVLDDVSNTLLWDDIQQCFPDDSNGSRILLTTRFRDCVRSYRSHDMLFLDPIDSWDLFCQTLSLKRCMTPKFEEIGKRLVGDCQGLPRAIMVVAQRLSKCNYILKEWKKVEKELLSLGILHKDTQHSSKLTHMYNQLPQHLKVCFLYLVVFPKDVNIKVKRLIRLWIAEGFVKPLKGVPLEDIAYRYVRDLWRRGLLSISSMWFWMHNDMHNFCVREAQKEGLLCAVNTRQCIGWPIEVLANSCRWLSLRSHILDYHVLFSSNIPRSLFFFHEDPEMFLPFKYLRVLDLSEYLIPERVPFPLGDLVFLRYLSVQQWFEGLDEVVSTNSNLQTLIVSGIGQSTHGAPTLHLSSKIWEPQHLRHLKLGGMYMVDPPNMVKEHLQTLVCAMPVHFRKEVYYCRFPSIRKLKILYKDVLKQGCTRGSCRNPIIILDNFEDLLRLETLSIIVPVGCITLLERLGFPANLKKLRLGGTNFPVKVLRVIGELPVLKELKLENAFYGRVWEVAEGGFRELEKLWLEARNLERWLADGIHFPKLEKLVLRRCYCLEDIPPSFAESPLYWSIVLERCPPSVVTSAKWIKVQRMRNKLDMPCVTIDGKILSESEDEDFDDEWQYTDKEESEKED